MGEGIPRCASGARSGRSSDAQHRDLRERPPRPVHAARPAIVVAPGDPGGTSPGAPGISRWTSSPRSSPCRPTPPTSWPSCDFARANGLQRRAAGDGPRRRGDRLARGHDPRADAAHARRRDRSRGADRPRAGRHALARGDRGRDAARPVPALGLVARRRRRRLHARRRPELARPQARAGREPRHGDRARDAGRRAGARHGRRPRRPVLGAARRRRQLRRRDRDGVPPVPVRRGLRGHVPVPVRARGRGPVRLARVDADRARRRSRPRCG